MSWLELKFDFKKHRTIFKDLINYLNEVDDLVEELEIMHGFHYKINDLVYKYITILTIYNDLGLLLPAEYIDPSKTFSGSESYVEILKNYASGRYYAGGHYFDDKEFLK